MDNLDYILVMTWFIITAQHTYMTSVFNLIIC